MWIVCMKCQALFSLICTHNISLMQKLTKNSSGFSLYTKLCQIYIICPKYWDTSTPYHTSLKIWRNPSYYLLMYLKCFWMNNKCWPWSDVTYCGIWSEPTLFAQACQSLLGLFRGFVKQYDIGNFGIIFTSSPEAPHQDMWVLSRRASITKTCLFKHIENFTTKIWQFLDEKFWYFSSFCSKHRLWVLVRTTSMRRF